MATVYLARQQGPVGFSKPVALERMLGCGAEEPGDVGAGGSSPDVQHELARPDGGPNQSDRVMFVSPSPAAHAGACV